MSIIIEADAVDVEKLKPHTVTGKLAGERLVIRMETQRSEADGPVPVRVITAAESIPTKEAQ